MKFNERSPEMSISAANRVVKCPRCGINKNSPFPCECEETWQEDAARTDDSVMPHDDLRDLDHEREDLIYQLLEEFKQSVGSGFDKQLGMGFIVGARAALAHPQPQQADGRGAVIEECAQACDEVAEFFAKRQLPVSHAAALNCAEDVRALQQSPTTE